jgi:alpha-D-xyloside xylohydrolase
VWIPPGEWENLWTGEVVTGPRTVTVACPLHQMPLFMRRGGLLLLAPDMAHTGEKAWDPVTVEAYPGAPGCRVARAVRG